MALHISNPKADHLARKLARQQRETVTDAVIRSLEERLDRTTEQAKGSRHKRKEAILEILREMDKLPVLDRRSPEEILDYDENGLPR
ncbi:MAG TPA: type II toxin-antitoxin system VapB family antitoxin [Rhizomicrobium sp.]|jgi:antitoxin VapB